MWPHQRSHARRGTCGPAVARRHVNTKATLLMHNIPVTNERKHRSGSKGGDEGSTESHPAQVEGLVLGAAEAPDAQLLGLVLTVHGVRKALHGEMDGGSPNCNGVGTCALPAVATLRGGHMHVYQCSAYQCLVVDLRIEAMAAGALGDVCL